MTKNYLITRKKLTPNPRDMEQAIEEVINGKSQWKVAEKFFVNHNIIQISQNGKPIKKAVGRTVLSTEAVQVNRIKTYSDWGYPIYSITLRLLIKDYVEGDKGK